MRISGILSAIFWIYINQNSKLVSLLEFRPIKYVGTVSYGIYLWQGFFLSTGPNRYIGQEWPLDPTTGVILLCITVPFSYHLVEKKFLTLKEKYSNLQFLVITSRRTSSEIKTRSQGHIMSILVIGEHNNKELKSSTLNSITAASVINDDIHVVVIGNNCEEMANRVATTDKVKKVLGPDGSAVCTVSLQAFVDAGFGKPDPNFDLTVRLPRKVFEDRDRMTIMLNTSNKMYVTIFNWNPYEKSDAQVRRVFPNRLDTNNLIRASATIPTNQTYSIQVQHPETKGDAFEYLHVVATRRPVNFLDSYSLHEFRKKVLEIPRRDRRHVRKPYRIVR